MLTLTERLQLLSMTNSEGLLDAPATIERPGYIVGWDKATASQIVSVNGVLRMVTPVGNKGLGSGRSIVVSAV